MNLRPALYAGLIVVLSLAHAAAGDGVSAGDRMGPRAVDAPAVAAAPRPAARAPLAAPLLDWAMPSAVAGPVRTGSGSVALAQPLRRSAQPSSRMADYDAGTPQAPARRTADARPRLDDDDASPGLHSGSLTLCGVLVAGLLAWRRLGA